MSEQASFYVVVLNYNNWSDTIECLESLFKSDDRNFHLVVLDNHSTDNSVKYIRMWAEGALDVWVPPLHPLKELSFPPINKVVKIREIGYDADSGIFQGDVKSSFSDAHAFSLITINRNLGFAGGINSALKFL